MKIIISPSKTLDFESEPKVKKDTTPKHLKDSAALVDVMRKKSPEDIAKLMSVSDTLAELNYNRYQSWNTPFTTKNAKQCIYAFKGDVYTGLDSESLGESDIQFAQEHLRILSGLYGLLRPLDLMQAYRLEMGIKLQIPKPRHPEQPKRHPEPTPRHPERSEGSKKTLHSAQNDNYYKNLYEFWGDRLTQDLGDDVIINLASNEYSKAVKPKNELVVDFKETKDGKLKTIGIFAKKARGLMARYIIQNKITNPAKIKDFNIEGYEFREDLSDNLKYIFAR